MSYIDLFNKNEIIVAPGIYDPLSALIAEKTGFKFLYLSGASISYSYIGLPDMSFTSLTDVESVLRRITNRINTPIICDADTGYGNERNVEYTVKLLERAGAAAIQIEDQKSPKRCGHLAGKEVLPCDEMIIKIKTAVNTRKKSLIIARTDSLSINGIDDAIERANLYLEAGADIAFVEAPRNYDDLKKIGKSINGYKMANMVEGGKTPLIPAKELKELGFNLVIYPGAAIRAITRTLENLYYTIKKNGTTENFLDSMIKFDELQQLLGINNFITQK